MSPMSAPQSTSSPPEDGRSRPFEWWHHSHPTFAALAGFFSGMLFVTAVPGAFAGILRLLLPYDRAEELFPWVAVGLVVPVVLLSRRKTRRFAQYMVVGMALTALVVLGVASLVLYFMVRQDS
jgi:4-amino-4-deoxy-L-arabinose transferase-like glycosyltransferase